MTASNVLGFSIMKPRGRAELAVGNNVEAVGWVVRHMKVIKYNKF